MEIQTAIQELAPLLSWVWVIVIGLTTLWGQLGVKGKAQLLSSLATGLVVGSFFGWVEVQPTDLVTWVVVGTFGLITGLEATGLYETGKGLFKKYTQLE